MIVRIHGFDWGTYAEFVMPSLSRWLVDEDETIVHQLYKQTRSAKEEQFVPTPVQLSRSWVRAHAFVKQLPRGPHTRREYVKLCDAQHFTVLSDRYVHRHPPQLHANSEALRTIWGALVEKYCLPWLDMFAEESPAEKIAPVKQEMVQGELISLLHAAGLKDLAHKVNKHVAAEGCLQVTSPVTEEDEGGVSEKGMDEGETCEPAGILIGRLPTPLHLRGWLASHSVRAMALFELLACGRRAMPFGYAAGVPYSSYVGYLIPGEVRQLAICLQDVEPPNQAEAVVDYQNFRETTSELREFRMIDEVLPAHGGTFVSAVRIAARQGLGLICSIG